MVEAAGNTQPDAVRSTLAEVCASASFQRAPVLARLLTFLVEHEQEGRGQLLKETYVGWKLYNRDRDYDPKGDTVVRVNATRLRARLEDYNYAHRGAPLQIVLQKGSYVPIYRVGAKTGQACALGVEEVLAPMAGPQPQPFLVSAPPPVAPLAAAPLPPRRSWWLVAGLAALLLLSIAAGAVWRGPSRGPAPVWQERPFSRPGGMAQFPRFTPDGRTVVFAISHGDESSSALYAQDIQSDVPQRISPPGLAESRPAPSPDGRRLALLQVQPGGSIAIVVREMATGRDFVVGVPGGTSPWLCKLPQLSWTPDGTEIVTSALGAEGRCGIVAVSVTTRAVRTLTQSPRSTLGDLEPAVSPDGRTIAFLRENSFSSLDVYLVDADGGHLRPLTDDRREILGMTWDRRGTGLILAASGPDGLHHLVERDVESGQTTQLTDGGIFTAFPALAPDGGQVMFNSYRVSSKVFLVAEGKQTELLNDGSYNLHPELSPDGQHLAYLGDRTGSREVWIGNGDGENAKRLTYSAGSTAGENHWTPDGQALVYECRERGKSMVCLQGTARHNVETLTSADSDAALPALSRDGRRLYFLSNRSGRYEIYRQALVGEGAETRAEGPPVQVTDGGAASAQESWDGKSLYVITGGSPGRFLVIPRGASMVQTRQLKDLARTTERTSLAPLAHEAWTVSSQGILAVQESPAGAIIMLYPNGQGPPQRVLQTQLQEKADSLSLGRQNGTFYVTSVAQKTGELDILYRRKEPRSAGDR